MVTHEAPLDEYLKEMIAGINYLGRQVAHVARLLDAQQEEQDERHRLRLQNVVERLADLAGVTVEEAWEVMS